MGKRNAATIDRAAVVAGLSAGLKASLAELAQCEPTAADALRYALRRRICERASRDTCERCFRKLGLANAPTVANVPPPIARAAQRLSVTTAGQISRTVERV